MSPLRIATWNIRKAVGLDRRRDPERIMAVIAGLGAEIVALQEADRRLGDRPSALPRDRVALRTGLVPVEADNGRSLGWHGNAILVAPDFTVEDVARIDLPGLEPRGALVADLTRKGTTIRVAAVHLGLTRRHRRHQLATLRTFLDAKEPRPTVILGDFNEWSADKGLEALAGGFTIHAPGASFHAARPMARLDRVALCPRLTLTEARVVETPETRIASDHLPVWTAVRAG